MSLPDSLKFQIALSLIPGLGPVGAKKLIAYLGSVEAIFQSGENRLMKIPGIGKITAKSIFSQDYIAKAEREISFIQKNNIKVSFYLDDDYPLRLKRCVDAPLILYSKGNVNLNAEKVVAIVGTRNATDQGKQFCNDLVAEMAKNGGYCVISGLAYGIDISAHKACVKYKVPTVGVMGHGLDKIYPSLHKSVADKILNDGGLVSDFVSDTKIERQNFLQRNRIIAGLADATIIVESAKKGGALVTADIASSYNRDVFAVPGRITDTFSLGCNKLIKDNKAAMIECLEDLEYAMSWQADVDLPRKVQHELFIELSPDEQKIADSLESGSMFIDELCQQVGMPGAKVSSLLLGMEFNGVVKSLPGKMYRLS